MITIILVFIVIQWRGLLFHLCSFRFCGEQRDQARKKRKAFFVSVPVEEQIKDSFQSKSFHELFEISILNQTLQNIIVILPSPRLFFLSFQCPFTCNSNRCLLLLLVCAALYRIPQYYIILFPGDGVWQVFQETKSRPRTSEIKDITDGEEYRKQCQPGVFLADPNNFSLIFNTDGIPLFKSSGVRIWPIYLAVNELPPCKRYTSLLFSIYSVQLHLCS